MFTDRYFAKRRAKRSSIETPAVAHPPIAERSDAGLSLEDYARKHEMSESEVWRRLRRGELIGRTHHGRLTVFSSQAAADAAYAASAQADAEAAKAQPVQPPAEQSEPPRAVRGASRADADLLRDLHHHLGEDSRAADLPPLPGAASGSEPARAGAAGAGPDHAFLTLTGDRAHSPEMALLLDHLSLAKEENREILRLTQDSIRQVTHLTDSIVEMKDALLEAKETQILTLKEQLDAKEREIRKLLQQREDLEMLARTMAEQPR